MCKAGVEEPMLRFLSAAVLLQLCTSSAFAQTADEIVEKHLAAMGGREVLQRIRTRVSTGTVTVETAVGTIPGTVEAFDPAGFGEPGASGARLRTLKLDAVRALTKACSTNAIACLVRWLVRGLPDVRRATPAQRSAP